MTISIPSRIKPAATWSNDCQGKKDYDGPVIEISTRYWPSVVEQDKQDNHFNYLEVTDNGIVFGSHPYQENGLASAEAKIIICSETGEDTLVSQEFEGNDFEAVKGQVEVWVEEQVNRIVDTICRAFGQVRTEPY